MLKTAAKLGVMASLMLAGCSTSDVMSPEQTYGAVAPGPAVGSVARSNPRFGDAKPMDFGAYPPHSYAVHGTDVSKYQTSIDWQTARQSGISFAFIKATEGGDMLDPMFRQHWANARAAGVPRGAYHFFYFCRPAHEQAAWFIRNVPKDRNSLPPVLDVEWNPKSPTCTLRPPAATVQREMKIFLDIVERHYGKKPIIYTPIDFFDDNNLASFKGYQYWLRSVAGHPSTRFGSHPFNFWQYTGTGIVPGIRGQADINAFNGSQAQWKNWLAKHGR